VKPFHWKTPLLDFVLLFELAQELFQRRSIEPEVERKNVGIGETQRDKPQMRVRATWYSKAGSPICDIQ